MGPFYPKAEVIALAIVVEQKMALIFFLFPIVPDDFVGEGVWL